MKRFRARHMFNDMVKEFEYPSLTKARKDNPAFIDWVEIPNT